MGLYWLALLSAAATQAVNIGIMLVKGRRKDKGDRISDLHSAQNARFADMQAAADRNHAALVTLQSTVNDRFAKPSRGRCRQPLRRASRGHGSALRRQPLRRHAPAASPTGSRPLNARFAVDAGQRRQAKPSQRSWTLITDQGQDIQALDERLTGEIKAQGERIDRVLDVLRNHGERLARIEVKLDIEPSAEAA